MPSLLLVLLLSSAPKVADSPEARLRDALRSTTAQLRALEDQRAGWQAKEAQHQKDLEALRAELAAAKKTRSDASREKDLARRLAEQAQANAALTQSLGQCQGAARDLEQAKRTREGELKARLEVVSTRATACEAKNARMYRVSKDVLDWLSNLGVGTALLAREPFLGLKRVELENVAQDYADKLLDERVGH